MDQQLLTALRAIVDPQRLRIFARLATRPGTADDVATEMRQPLPAVRRSLDVLVGAGLVDVRQGASVSVGSPGAPESPVPRPVLFIARPSRVGELARALAAMEEATSGGAETRPDGTWPHDGETLAETLARMNATVEETRVLRSFLVDGRLASIPVQGRKRLVVLRFLLERVFAEARAYPEKEVNQRLAVFHPDVAALRRYLVDEGLADRAGGIYWRRGSGPEQRPEARPEG